MAKTKEEKSVTEIKERLERGDNSDVLEDQIETLNKSFNDLLAVGMVQFNRNFSVGERLIKLAFKAQSQCRSTVSLLNSINNPRHVVIAKQANIANNQQVNNNQVNSEKIKQKKARNELYKKGDEHAEMDATGAKEATRDDQAGKALVEVNRSENKGREGA